MPITIESLEHQVNHLETLLDKERNLQTWILIFMFMIGMIVGGGIVWLIQ